MNAIHGPRLPVDSHIEEISRRLAESRAVVLVAAPGAGKTTRVAPALCGPGPLVLLQPRRVAARALAQRIAVERGWTPGEEIGWHVRFEHRAGPRTRLLVATEGILTERLQRDPLLSEFRTVVLDEFHERSLHADLAIALAREAWRARDDLRLLVMSATLDAAPVAAYLDGCPVIEIPGRPHAVAVDHRPLVAPAEAIRETLRNDGAGHVLCFLPGAAEIRRVGRELAGIDAEVRPLHGALESAEQDAAIAPSVRRRVILATNIAETSLTIEGVTDVVDSGQHRLLRYDPSSGLDRLVTERIPRDAADQRAGRAGRTAPGRALRLWDPREELRPRREPEIERVDLAAPFLDVLAWGGDPRTFEWFTPPPSAAAARADELLERLGAVRDGAITELGRALRRLPLHPRLARVVLATGGSEQGAAACAVLAERWRIAGTLPTGASDLMVHVDRLREAPRGVQLAARQVQSQARAAAVTAGAPEADPERALRRALFDAYADRVARRREPGSGRLLLASGRGARLARESGVREAEFLVALDVAASDADPAAEPLVRLASRVEPEWLVPTARGIEHAFDRASGRVRAIERAWYGRLPLAERPVETDADQAAELLVAELRRRAPGAATDALLRRARFAAVEIDVEEARRKACRGRDGLPEFELRDWLPQDVRRRIDAAAPERLGVPSGRDVALDYRDDGSVHAAVKLQELFGLAETPRVGPSRVPVTFDLLAPNGRPVQTTRDLESFWRTTYPEVRRELRGRYPKHPWPEDPWTALPTHRTRRRRN